MSEDLASELGTRETAALEFKETGTKHTSKAILKAICAFANDLPRLGGGDLIIGVDKRGNPVDQVDTSDQELLALTDMRDNGKVIDRPSMTVLEARYQGSPVIRIRVEASSTPPVRLDGVVYVRPGPTTRRATRDDERVLTEHRRSSSGPYDNHPVEGTSMDDLDRTLFQREYLPALVAPDVLAENERPVEQQLASLGITDGNGTPTVMGLLVLGLDPTSSIPGAYYQFVRYSGDDVSAPVSDEQEIHANVIGTATRLEAVLRGHLHTSVTAASGFRDESTPDYPFEAIREAFMNALIHRNYETSYAPVRVSWFDDRIEVTNPGGPYGQVRPDNFDRVNDYRNPSLAGAMKALGYVNRFGRGIGRIKASLANNGNPPPEFTVDDSSWMVVMRRVT